MDAICSLPATRTDKVNSQGVIGSPALDSGLQATTDPV